MDPLVMRLDFPSETRVSEIRKVLAPFQQQHSDTINPAKFDKLLKVIVTARLDNHKCKHSRSASPAWLLGCLLFLTALVVRVPTSLFVNKNLLDNDSFDYHNLAVNIVRGHGYSADIAEPYHPHFFRESGYPAFLAGLYAIWRVTGHELDYLIWQQDGSGKYCGNNQAVNFARFCQGILDAFSTVLLFTTLSFVLRRSAAFWISIIYALYLPIAVTNTHILRESLLVFLTTGITYLFAGYMRNSKFMWLFLCSVLMAVSVLTFQATLPLMVFASAFLVTSKGFKKGTQSAMVMVVVIAACASPWVIRSYRFCHDWRVVRTVGSSFTWEFRNYLNVLSKAFQYGLFPSYKAFEGYVDQETLLADDFQKSFDGYFKSQANFWSERIKVRSCSAAEPDYRRDYYRRCLQNFFVQSNWAPWINLHRPHGVINSAKGGQLSILSLYLLSFFVGVASLVGACMWWRRLYPITVAWTCYLVLFPVIGTEPRRFMPVYGITLAFACLAVQAGWLAGARKFRARVSDADNNSSGIAKDLLNLPVDANKRLGFAIREIAMPLVTVIIPMFDRRNLIDQTLNSVDAQTIAERIETIVVDDGSTDGGAENVRARTVGPGGLLLIQTQNRGASAARNSGMEQVRTPFVSFLDSDDLIAPHKLEKQLACFGQTAEVGYVTCDWSTFEKEPKNPVEKYDNNGSVSWPILPDFLQGRFFHTGVPVYRFETCKKTGPWPEKLRVYEDWAWHVAMGLTGAKGIHCSECLFFSREHGFPRLSHTITRNKLVADYCKYAQFVITRMRRNAHMWEQYGDLACQTLFRGAIWTLRVREEKRGAALMRRALVMHPSQWRRFLYGATFHSIRWVGSSNVIEVYDRFKTVGLWIRKRLKS